MGPAGGQAQIRVGSWPGRLFKVLKNLEQSLRCDVENHLAISYLMFEYDPQWCYKGIRTEPVMTIDDKTRTELEAAAFRRLVQHLRSRTDVQNIDLMNLAGFCRNCLSNWLKEEADAKGVAMSKDESREAVYGMPYETWKERFQGTATPEQLEAMAKVNPRH